MTFVRHVLFCGWAAAVLSVMGCGGGQGTTDPRAPHKKPTVAYVTNGIASFWVIAQKGAEAGAKEFDAHIEVRMPPKGVADQKRMVEELLAKKIDGIAISPIDPANQGDLLDEVAQQTRLITQDSDAPASKRLCYIGMDNYSAGRMCGELVKQALPNGGSVMLFVGRLGQDNARQRRQGVIDALLNRESDPQRDDPNGEEIRGDKYVILDTRTDNFDFARAKALAQDAITKYPDLGCMVGLFAYNPPQILGAVAEANKLNQIKIVGFDEEAPTLQGIIDGSVYGTVVQNPFEYGRQSVRVLSALQRGDSSVIPASKFIDIPARSITQANVAAFWSELKSRIGE